MIDGIKFNIAIPWSSKNFHDKWVYTILQGKQNGFFIDVGCTLGSNSTIALETNFGWTGILINAHPDHIENVRENRPGQQVIHAALFEYDGILGFNYVDLSAEITAHGRTDKASFLCTCNDERVETKWSPHIKLISTLIPVPAISPRTLLDKTIHPDVIDYLALDVEGSEYFILKNWPFDNTTVLLVSAECGKYDTSIIKIMNYNNFEKVINPYAVDNTKMYFKNKAINFS